MIIDEEEAEDLLSEIEKLIKKQYTIYNNEIIPDLKKNDIHILKYGELSKTEKEIVLEYYEETIFPILTPTAIDASRPFPLLQNKSLNIIVELKGEKNLYSFVQVPSIINRFYKLPSKQGYRFILLEEIIKQFIDTLFEGFAIKKMSELKETRD